MITNIELIKQSIITFTCSFGCLLLCCLTLGGIEYFIKLTSSAMFYILSISFSAGLTRFILKINKVWLSFLYGTVFGLLGFIIVMVWAVNNI